MDTNGVSFKFLQDHQQLQVQEEDMVLEITYDAGTPGFGGPGSGSGGGGHPQG